MDHQVPPAHGGLGHHRATGAVVGTDRGPGLRPRGARIRRRSSPPGRSAGCRARTGRRRSSERRAPGHAGGRGAAGQEQEFEVDLLVRAVHALEPGHDPEGVEGHRLGEAPCIGGPVAPERGEGLALQFAAIEGADPRPGEADDRRPAGTSSSRIRLSASRWRISPGSISARSGRRGLPAAVPNKREADGSWDASCLSRIGTHVPRWSPNRDVGETSRPRSVRLPAQSANPMPSPRGIIRGVQDWLRVITTEDCSSPLLQPGSMLKAPPPLRHAQVAGPLGLPLSPA